MRTRAAGSHISRTLTSCAETDVSTVEFLVIRNLWTLTVRATQGRETWARLCLARISRRPLIWNQTFLRSGKGILFCNFYLFYYPSGLGSTPRDEYP